MGMPKLLLAAGARPLDLFKFAIQSLKPAVNGNYGFLYGTAIPESPKMRIVAVLKERKSSHQTHASYEMRAA